MSNQYIFQRVEKKYQLNQNQYEAFLTAIQDRLHPDQYGYHTIHNLYYDTPDYELIRNSIEKPKYKEKFRVRGYGKITDDSPVFLEIKKKYRGIVYKRRTSLSMKQAKVFLETGTLLESDNQIMREIAYFMQFYHPVPQVYLAYDRTAYISPDDPDLRITIDQNIRSRYHRLNLEYDGECRILNPGMYLMEIKVPAAYPVWLASLLCSLQIYPVSFSKYGNVYSDSVQRGELHPWSMAAPTSPVSSAIQTDIPVLTHDADKNETDKEKENSCSQVYSTV